jgi:hypothetical protein
MAVDFRAGLKFLACRLILIESAGFRPGHDRPVSLIRIPSLYIKFNNNAYKLSKTICLIAGGGEKGRAPRRDHGVVSRQRRLNVKAQHPWRLDRERPGCEWMSDIRGGASRSWRGMKIKVDKACPLASRAQLLEKTTMVLDWFNPKPSRSRA